MMSPEYNHQWKEIITPGKRVIPTLRASGRRTSGSGCGGWRSPNQSDGEGGTMDVIRAQWEGLHPKLKLRDQAPLAGWPMPRTPTGGAESAERKQELGRTTSGGGDLQAAAMMAGWILQNENRGRTRKRWRN